MDQVHLYAYETLGAWHITITWRAVDDYGEHWESTLYRGDHVPIDEEDPLIRAVLLLDQASADMNSAIRHNTDIVADRPLSH